MRIIQGMGTKQEKGFKQVMRITQQARNQDFRGAGRLSTKAELIAGRLSTKVELIQREIDIYAAINAYALLPCTKIVITL